MTAADIAWHTWEAQQWLAAVRSRGLALRSLDPAMNVIVYALICIDNEEKLKNIKR